MIELNNDIKVVISDEVANWNAYLRNHTMCYAVTEYSFKKILERTYSCETLMLSAKHDDKVVGILPLYIVKSPRRWPLLYSPRYGLVADNKEAAIALSNKAYEIALKCNTKKALITSGIYHFDLPFNTIAKTTMGINLSLGLEAIWMAMRDKTRNAIRKGEKLGLSICKGEEHLADFYWLYSQKMLSKSVPIHSREYFKELVEVYGNRCQILIAKVNSQPIAGMLLLDSENVCLYAYSGSIGGYGKYCAPQFLLWESIKQASSQGQQYFDMGESTEGSGVYDFKRWFGAEPKSIYYYDLLAKPSSAVAEPCQKGLIDKSHIDLLQQYMQRSPRLIRKPWLKYIKKHSRIF